MMGLILCSGAEYTYLPQMIFLKNLFQHLVCTSTIAPGANYFVVLVTVEYLLKYLNIVRTNCFSFFFPL